MGKYTSMTKKKETPRITGVNRWMQGLGCFIILLVPPLSYGIADLIVVPLAQANNFPIPPEWLGFVDLPPWLWQAEGLTPILGFIEKQEDLVVNLVFAIAIAVVIGGIMAIFFGYLYKFLGPPEYGPHDVPPIRVKVKRYKR